MKKNWLYIVCFACMATACSGTPQTVNERLCSVDVASAMENLTELKLSELGKDVRYVALETTDSCLIGAGPDILLLDKYIVVFSHKDCFVFDKADGRFISKVGHTGDDPEAYSYAAATYNDVDGLLYFQRAPNMLQKYDVQGNYRGRVTIPTPPAAPGDFAFTDSLIIGHYNNIAMGYNARALLFFNEAGEQVDTVPSLFPVLPEKQVQDIASISIKKQGISAIVLTIFKDGSQSAAISGHPFLWKIDGKIQFKESFNDTVYTVKRDMLEPSVVFSTGKWHWGAEARTDSKDNESRLLVGAVFETENNIFFQCTRGLYTSEPEAFNGIHDRKSGTTRMYTEKEGITDDLTGFMPFHPKTCSMLGEYAMIVGSDEVLGWLEEHPEEAGNEKLAVLKTLTEDSNPVVVMTLP